MGKGNFFPKEITEVKARMPITSVNWTTHPGEAKRILRKRKTQLEKIYEYTDIWHEKIQRLAES